MSTASITARISSVRCSSVAMAVGRSDRPVPRLSKRTSRNIDPTELTLTDNVQKYQQIFRNEHTELVKFMKFVLGLSYLLLEQTGNLRVEDVYPFIGITYFIYDKLNHSTLLDAVKGKTIILRDIRNLWSIFLFRKTNSHTNL